MLFNFIRTSQVATITIADKTKLAIVGYGSLKLQFPEWSHTLLVDVVPLVPDTYFSLISQGMLGRVGNEFKVDGGKIIMLGTDLDFKLEITTFCARVQCVSHDTRQRLV